MKIILEISKTELNFVSGCGSCYGVWLGTTDGNYGVCIGVSVQ